MTIAKVSLATNKTSPRGSYFEYQIAGLNKEVLDSCGGL